MQKADDAAAPNSRKKPPPLRERLLELAFEEMYESGFGGLRIDTLIEKAGSTKGAFYHHFPSKAALGYAVVDEILETLAEDIWGGYLQSFDDPAEGIEACARRMMQHLGPRCMKLGCPFNNLAQEMGAIDDGFRTRLGAIFTKIIGHIAEALRQGQDRGVIRADIDAGQTAHFIFAALEGSMGLFKTMGQGGDFDGSMRGVQDYLASLRSV